MNKSIKDVANKQLTLFHFNRDIILFYSANAAYAADTLQHVRTEHMMLINIREAIYARVKYLMYTNITHTTMYNVKIHQID